MKEIEKRQYVLGELQRAFDKKVSASDILDSKLQNILDYSSIIVAVFTAITTSTLVDKVGFLYWLGLIIILFLYIVIYIKIKRGLSPTEFYNPISNNEQELFEKFIDVKQSQALDISIKAYLYSMYETDKTNNKKAIVLSRSSNLMFGIVVLLLLSIFLGLLFPHLKFDDLIQFVLNILKVKP